MTLPFLFLCTYESWQTHAHAYTHSEHGHIQVNTRINTQTHPRKRETFHHLSTTQVSARQRMEAFQSSLEIHQRRRHRQQQQQQQQQAQAQAQGGEQQGHEQIMQQRVPTVGHDIASSPIVLMPPSAPQQQHGTESEAVVVDPEVLVLQVCCVGAVDVVLCCPLSLESLCCGCVVRCPWRPCAVDELSVVHCPWRPCAVDVLPIVPGDLVL